VLTGGAGRRALDRAFEDVFGVPEAFEAVPMAGRTDPLIIRDACARHGVVLDGRHDALQERYFEHLARELPRGAPGKRLLPGVRPLLEALQADSGAILGLLTGNFAASARLKLEQFELWHYFETGAYGDDAPERIGLVEVAVRRVAERGHEAVPFSRVVVVGDTPHDVACARAAGARSLAVATGSSTTAELEAAGADVAIPDLASTSDVLDLIGALAGGNATGWD
jgi:phosphoglycolate phosphatase-like HAD superfamily hydrolase